ncbi:hypothetical protein ILUMI_03108 [Ignelater luminosus]|uniref:Uncharacterized protein n=1 Tax=Ignelater luminosus TaxID=2038154 RepID=A0A8K0GK85_IGNLU|nr:hypothetical protein ILUMI_03108 [Ignelater luminosus]
MDDELRQSTMLEPLKIAYVQRTLEKPKSNMKHTILRGPAEIVKQISMGKCHSRIEKKGQGAIKIDEYILIWSGVHKSEAAKAGVAKLIKKNISKDIRDIQYVSDSHLKVIMKIRRKEYDAQDETKEEFYNSLNKLIGKTKRHQQLIIVSWKYEWKNRKKK